MAPLYGTPNYDFHDDNELNNYDDSGETKNTGSSEVTMWYSVVLVGLMLIWLIVFFSLRLLTIRQKTRSPQQRRAYVASRTRPSLSQSEPTIYVSPSNLPPPPKYEAMAPPSYEEVVGIHYPSYQPHIQPITHPIASAMVQSSNVTTTNGEATNRDAATENKIEANTSPSTVITVTTDDARTSVTVATT